LTLFLKCKSVNVFRFTKANNQLCSFLLLSLKKFDYTGLKLDDDPFTAKMDVDSVYFGASTLSKISSMAGTKCAFSLKSKLCHTSSAFGTRFSLDCRELRDHPILLRGLKAGTIGYDRLPNIRIAECYLSAVPGHVMSIYLTLTGVERLRRTNYFCFEEVAIINAAMNLATLTMKSSNEEMLYRDNVLRFPKFETMVKGSFGRYIACYTHPFGSQTMKLFSSFFDKALNVILSHSKIEVFMKPLWAGMRYDNGQSGYNTKKLKAAVATFKRGMHYTANLAGIKDVFKENPDFCKDFDDLNSNDWNEYVEVTTNKAYLFLKNEMFPNAKLTENDIYHFDLGLEVSPSFKSRNSFLVNMKFAKERLNEIFKEVRVKNAHDYCSINNDDVRRAFGNDGSEAPTSIHQQLDTTMLGESDQQLFDLGETWPAEDLEDLIADPDYIPEEELISSRDLFFENRKLGVNCYLKLLSNGNIGGVHSGQPSIWVKESPHDADAINTEREVISSRTSMEVCGGQVYDPGSMADNLTKQRKNMDDFAALPNLLARILSSNKGSIDDERQEMYKEFMVLTNNLDWFIEDCLSAIKNSSQHSTRFEFFFVSNLQSFHTDVSFPDVNLEEFIFVTDHEKMREATKDELESNMKPLVSFVGELQKHTKMDSLPNPEGLSPSTKTRLVCCSEIIVTLIETKGFQGRVMKCIQNEVAVSEPDALFFSIPATYHVQLLHTEVKLKGLEYGLLPRLLTLPAVSDISAIHFHHWKPESCFANRYAYTDFPMLITFFTI
jgi:hypothetical protein